MTTFFLNLPKEIIGVCAENGIDGTTYSLNNGQAFDLYQKLQTSLNAVSERQLESKIAELRKEILELGQVNTQIQEELADTNDELKSSQLMLALTRQELAEANKTIDETSEGQHRKYSLAENSSIIGFDVISVGTIEAIEDEFEHILFADLLVSSCDAEEPRRVRFFNIEKDSGVDKEVEFIDKRIAYLTMVSMLESKL